MLFGSNSNKKHKDASILKQEVRIMAVRFKTGLKQALLATTKFTAYANRPDVALGLPCGGVPVA